MFGEYGLVMKTLRSASILAVEDTNLFVIERKYFLTLMEQAEQQRMQNKITFFKQSFKGEFSPNELQRLMCDFSTKKIFRASYVLFKEK